MAVDKKLTQAAEKIGEKKTGAKTVDGEAPAKSKGKKLDTDTAKALEDAFGKFGKRIKDVQVHTGKEAAEACKQMGAKAFTVGTDIFFASSSDAKNAELLAHSVAHAVQQSKAKKGKVDVIK